MLGLFVLILIACAAFIIVNLLTGVMALAALAFIAVLLLGITSGSLALIAPNGRFRRRP